MKILSMSWEVRVPRGVHKQVRRLPGKDQERILDIFRDLRTDPWSGDITKIGGREDLWRRRVGNYRIFYSVHQNEKIVAVKGVERRTSNTY